MKLVTETEIEKEIARNLARINGGEPDAYMGVAAYWVSQMPDASESGWIPFKSRPLTDEEKKEHPECSFIVDCQLPENGQRILVSIDVAGHERVQLDEFYDDDGVYLDSGYAIGAEAVAWMPLPEPYQPEETDAGN